MTDQAAPIPPSVRPAPRIGNVTTNVPYRRWTERLARFGYGAKGIVYVVIGVLAIQAAIGAGGDNSGSRGAVTEIARQPFGEVMLWIVACGLLAYALWRFIQAVLDPERDGSGTQHAVKRGAYFVSGLIHASLAAFAVQVALGSASGGDDSSQELTAAVLAQPFGQWLVGAAGVTVGIAGVVQFYRAKTAKFMNKVKHEISGEQRKWARSAGTWGFGARGVVFGLIGWFLIQAAVRADPSAAQGLGGALDELAQQAYGA